MALSAGKTHSFAAVPKMPVLCRLLQDVARSIVPPLVTVVDSFAFVRHSITFAPASCLGAMSTCTVGTRSIVKHPSAASTAAAGPVARGRRAFASRCRLFIVSGSTFFSAPLQRASFVAWRARAGDFCDSGSRHAFTITHHLSIIAFQRTDAPVARHHRLENGHARLVGRELLLRELGELGERRATLRAPLPIDLAAIAPDPIEGVLHAAR